MTKLLIHIAAFRLLTLAAVVLGAKLKCSMCYKSNMHFIKTIVIVPFLFLIGCVTQNYNETGLSYDQRIVEFTKEDLADARIKLWNKKQEFITSKDKDVINKQQIDIQKLEDRIKELEAKLAGLEVKQQGTSQANSTAQTNYSPPLTPTDPASQNVFVGPRGGCYVYSKNGKKRYVKC